MFALGSRMIEARSELVSRMRTSAPGSKAQKSNSARVLSRRSRAVLHVRSAAEVEILRAQLHRFTLGKRVDAVHVPEAFLRNLPPRPQALLHGSRVAAVRRLVTWLAIELDTGLALGLHLGQGGTLSWGETEDQEALTLHLEHGKSLLAILPSADDLHLLPAHGFARLPAVKRLGTDVLSADFTLDALCRCLARAQKRALRSALLDQRLLAGLDSWLVDEILLRARLHPQTRATQLTPAQRRTLFETTVTVLRLVIERGGCAATGFVDLQGRSGTFEPVGYGAYRRHCPVCTTTLVGIRCGRRPAVLCPTCQGLP